MTADYVGRFAPSPTGPLHQGSLVAALGSALDARAAGGAWLLRIEDLDTPRLVPGATDGILRTLERFGFEWQGPVVYQHRRLDLYRDALAQLAAKGLLFECSCSRRDRRVSASGDTGYPGTCRGGPRDKGPTTTRFRIDDRRVECFDDRVQGRVCMPLAPLGDVVLRRRDGIIAYQLAVVVDDAEQGITDVVRGADLLASTPWQLSLQRVLELPTPRYAHLPVVTEADGTKLAKSRRSLPVGADKPDISVSCAESTTASKIAVELWRALRLLGQAPPVDLTRASIADVWSWAVNHWSLQHIAGQREIRAEGQTAPH